MMKNPFSVFDFFGYVFPGAFALMAVSYFVKMMPLDFVDPMSLEEVITTVKGWLQVSEPIVSCSVFLILSYIVGHLIAYISSITVERFVIWWYGFPSEFLMKDEGGVWYFLHEGVALWRNKNAHYKREIFRTYTLRVVVSLLLFPIFVPTIVVKM